MLKAAQPTSVVTASFLAKLNRMQVAAYWDIEGNCKMDEVTTKQILLDKEGIPTSLASCFSTMNRPLLDGMKL